MCVGAHVSQRVCKARGQTTCWFSPSDMWVPEKKLDIRLGGLSLDLLSHLELRDQPASDSQC